MSEEVNIIINNLCNKLGTSAKLPPEPQWIPLSEKLPEEETYVLISKKPSPLSGKKWCVTIAGRFVDGRSKKVEWRDIGFGRIYDYDVLAWMPLPEPWKGES